MKGCGCRMCLHAGFYVEYCAARLYGTEATDPGCLYNLVWKLSELSVGHMAAALTWKVLNSLYLVLQLQVEFTYNNHEIL